MASTDERAGDDERGAGSGGEEGEPVWSALGGEIADGDADQPDEDAEVDVDGEGVIEEFVGEDAV